MACDTAFSPVSPIVWPSPTAFGVPTVIARQRRRRPGLAGGDAAGVGHRGEVGLGVGARAGGVGDEVLEVADAVAVGLAGDLERLEQRVLAAEADAGEVGLAAGLAALAPADDDRRDVEEVAQGEVERRDQHARAAVADHRAVGVDVERAPASRRPTAARRGARPSFSASSLALVISAPGPNASSIRQRRAGRRVGGRPQRDLGTVEPGQVDQHLRGQLAQADQARGAGADRVERRLRHPHVARRAGQGVEQRRVLRSSCSAGATGRASSRSAPGRARTASWPGGPRTCPGVRSSSASGTGLRHSAIESRPPNAADAATRNSNGSSQQLGQRHRQGGERAEAGVDEQLRLQRRAEPGVVVEQAVHVADRRVAHLAVRDAGHRAQAADARGRGAAARRRR